MPNVLCLICGESVHVDIRSRSGRGDAGKTYEQLLTEISDISGRSLRQMIVSVFSQDKQIQQIISYNALGKDPPYSFTSKANNDQGVCGTCYNLLEQVSPMSEPKARRNVNCILIWRVGYKEHKFNYNNQHQPFSG